MARREKRKDHSSASLDSTRPSPGAPPPRCDSGYTRRCDSRGRARALRAAPTDGVGPNSRVARTPFDVSRVVPTSASVRLVRGPGIEQADGPRRPSLCGSACRSRVVRPGRSTSPRVWGYERERGTNLLLRITIDGPALPAARRPTSLVVVLDPLMATDHAHGHGLGGVPSLSLHARSPTRAGPCPCGVLPPPRPRMCPPRRDASRYLIMAR
jgi:hypothetical protein